MEFKKSAVQAYIGGEGSYRELCKKFGVSHNDVLRKWVLWYNGHKEFKKRSSAKGEIYMTKGRKTTQEERAEMVAFCIEILRQLFRLKNGLPMLQSLSIM